mgnify:FL=1
MLGVTPFLLVLVALVASAVVSASDVSVARLSRELRKRDTASTDASEFNGKSFDYVIIGGGLAGLVVASRLTENPNITVAVIEAGTSGTAKNESEKILPPAANLYNSPGQTYMNWHYKTVPQPQLNNRVAPWPRGKVLGGSSAINGLYYVRHSVHEQDAWGDVIGAKDLWGWDNMYRAMKKSEAFTGPLDSVAQIDQISPNPDSHGMNGPINSTWPAVTYECVGAFVNASSSVATPHAKDPYGGTNLGTYVATLNINPSNWTRSFARTGYYDPYVYRSNLHVLTRHLVTKIEFDTSGKQIKATDVKFKSDPNSDEYTVKAGREVIVSGGAINTPQILQLSGIGDKDFLKSKGIDVVLESPAVGYNLQDHISGGVEWHPKDSTKMPPSDINESKEVNSYTNSGVAYVNGSQILKDQWNSYIDQVKGNKSKAVDAYNGTDAAKKGYDLTYSTVLGVIQKNVATVEMLFSMAFGQVQVQSALQHAFSRGHVLVNSNDPFQAPNIDPRYFEQSSDLDMLRGAFKLAREVGQAQPLNSFLDQETHPGTNVTSDQDWDNFIRDRVGTEYHPSGTAAMLPQDKGGVVDKNLMVYGTSNLRVIDASVVPFVVASHFMSLVYGVAEVGAEVVLEAYKQSNSGGDGEKKGNDNGDAKDAEDHSGGAASAGAKNSTGKSDSGNNAQDASSTLYTGSKVYSTIVMSALVAFFTICISL